MSFDDEIIEDFLIESAENLETLDKCLMAIENGEPADVDAIFRAMHSVKSAAGFLEIVTLEKIAHSAETSLSGYKALPVSLIGSKAIMVPLGLAMATVSILILIDRGSATQRFIYMIF